MYWAFGWNKRSDLERRGLRSVCTRNEKVIRQVVRSLLMNTLNVITKILKSIRYLTGNQWSWINQVLLNVTGLLLMRACVACRKWIVCEFLISAESEFSFSDGNVFVRMFFGCLFTSFVFFFFRSDRKKKKGFTVNIWHSGTFRHWYLSFQKENTKNSFYVSECKRF